MQTLPKKVRVNGHDYRIHSYDPHNTSRTENFGECQKDSNLILIQDSLERGIEKEVVLHELLHAVWNEYCLEELFSSEHEELLVSVLSKGLHSLFRANPKLIKYLSNNTARQAGDTGDKHGKFRREESADT